MAKDSNTGILLVIAGAVVGGIAWALGRGGKAEASPRETVDYPAPSGDGSTFEPPVSPRVAGTLEDRIRAEAERQGLPAWLAVATAIIEDDLRNPPSGPNECQGNLGCSTYPMGLKPGAAADEVRGLSWPKDTAELDRRVRDVARHVEMAVHRLKRFYDRYGGDHMMVRVAWKYGPGVGNRVRDGAPFPDSFFEPWRGGPSPAERWASAIERAGGPPGA